MLQGWDLERFGFQTDEPPGRMVPGARVIWGEKPRAD